MNTKIEGAFQGIKVLELTRGKSGAFCGMMLADNGAEVIKVNELGWDSAQVDPYYSILDRGKVVYEGDISFGERKFISLLRIADVLVSDFELSELNIGNFSYDRLKEINAGLIFCSITAYGEMGYLSEQPPVGDLIKARTGFCSSMPGFSEGDTHVMHPVAELGAGVLASLGVTASLYKRLKTNCGGVVRTSLYAGCLLFSPKAEGDRVKARSVKVTAYGGGPFYSVFECMDGEWLQLGCIHGGFVDMAATAMGISDVMLDPRFGDGRTPVDEDARAELFEIVKDSIKRKTSAEWEDIFTGSGVPFALVNTAEESMTHEQVIHNKMVYECIDPILGEMLQPGIPIQLSETPGKVKGPRVIKDLKDMDYSSVSESDSRSDVESHETGRLPLDGVKVSDITNVIAGPVAGRLLADLGADVIKIEPPYGDISRPASGPYFHALNANKRSVAIDAKTVSGQRVLQRIVSDSDVLIANLRPGATARIGLSEQVLRDSNPKLIETHITAFGWDGPFSGRPGVDPLAQAWMGLQMAQGGGNERPSFLPPVAPTDYTAGAMGALGAVMGLFVAEKYGYGQNVQTNLLNAGCFLTEGDFSKYSGKIGRRLSDKAQKGLSDFHRLYETADGWIYISAEEMRPANDLLEIMGLKHKYKICSEFFRSHSAGHSDMGDEIQKVMRVYGTSHWCTILDCKRIFHAPSVRFYDKVFFEDSQAVDNGMIVKCELDSGEKYSYSGNLIQFDEVNESEFTPTPLLGEQSLEILTEVGFQIDEINSLINENVIFVNGKDN